jgi:hypothetical protein
MAGEKRKQSEASRTKADLAVHAKAALHELVSAWECARDVKSDPWDFAVEIGDLMALGLGRSGLRWLVRKGYVEHAREVIRSGDSSRRFQPELSLAFTNKTCLILTDAGHSLLGTEESTPTVLRLHEPAATPAVAAPIPHWDPRMRTLYLGDRIVKRYRVPAANQEVVLSAFEEAGWTQVIDDPLPDDPDQVPKNRLHFTIHRLNQCQETPLIRFCGDGTGQGICWERISSASLSRTVDAAPKKPRLAA